MTDKDIIYIAVVSVLALYAIFLTVLLIVMNNRAKKTNSLLEEKINKNSEEIANTTKKMDEQIDRVDSKIELEKENTEKKIGEIFDNTMTATSMLIDEKTKNLTDKMDDIALKLNIMDSAVKNIEREKVMIHSLLTDGDEPVEVQYHDVPKDSFANNARKAMSNVAQKGSKLVKSIKKNFPGIAKTAIKIIKK